MGHKSTFTDIINFMIQKARENKDKPHGGGGGGGCCGEEEPATPDSFITQYLPKLTDTLIEILAEAPFNGESSMTVGEGESFKFKGEMLLKTILAWSLRVLGGGLRQKRKISLEASENQVTVRCEKLPFMKEDPHSSKLRTFVVLVDLSDNSMHIKEISKEDVVVETKFQIKATATEQKRNFKAYVVSGDGQIETSKEISAIE